MKRIRPVKNKLKKLLLLIFLIGISFFMYYNSIISRPLKNDQNIVAIEVKQGDGFYDVLNKLEKQDKLRNKLLIKLKLAIDGKNINLNEGIYEISSETTLDNLIRSLENNSDNVNLVKVTIPEGYNVEEIGERLEECGFFTKEEFINAVKGYQLPDFIEVKDKTRYNLEGFLYPDTYLIQKGTNAEDIINMMIERFNTVVHQVEEENNTKLDKSKLFDTITIASMIEKEARVEEDRPLIASVINNRLEKNMKLQLDATVLYSLGYHVETVLNKHLQVDSLYNTYKYEGLPEGPICNPGIESIRAALNPKESNYIYYILQKDGSHYFTNSYDDFLDKKKELGY